jgi:non-ribosomal peptide synthetase component F/thioesterase domain-containing protein
MATASKYLFRTSAGLSEAAPTELAPNLTGSSAEPVYMDFPCSVAQERFWLLDRLEPGNPAYNVAVRWKLEGRISSDLLESAWREIIARHEVLRTRFLEVDGKPVQRVAAQGSFKLVEIDLSSLPEAARAEEGDRIGLIEARAPFDVGTGPLIRVVLLRFSTTSAIILVTTHQIVSDGWSIGVMAREMGTIYQSLAMGEPPSLEPLAIQYGDYAKWQLEWLRQRGIEAETAYWSRQLSGVAPFEVIADRPRPTVPTTNGAIASIVLPRDLTNRLHELSADCGATLFAAAVSVLSATLARYTGQSEIVIGTQVSDRDQVELEPMIGQFVNSLILRNDLRGDPRFTELLQRTSLTISEALEHKNIPIERLLGMVKAGRGGSNSPPVSVNFIFQRTFIENRQYGALTLEDMPSLPAGAIYDLNFFMVERPDGWRFSCQYNTDQFEAATAERLLTYFESALRSAVENRERRVSELRLSSSQPADPQRQPLRGPAGSPNPQTLCARISAQAIAAPETPVLHQADQRLTLSQMEVRSADLARRLISLGVGAGQRVALCLDRLSDYPVALLAILKSGAAVVPLDPRLPSATRQRLINAADARLLLASPATAAGLEAPVGVITDISGGADHAAAVLPQINSDSAAVVYVSDAGDGGTEAVAISHRVLSDRLASLSERAGITGADGFVAAAGDVPDPMLLSCLLPLYCHAPIVIPDQAEAAEPDRLARYLERMRVTVAYATDSIRPLQSSAANGGFPLRKWLCDRCSASNHTVSRALSGGAEVWVVQTSVRAGGAFSVQQIREPHELRLIGQPLADVEFSVLDAAGKVPPVGAAGQLRVRADGISDGRSIFTGDIARFRADGRVELINEQDLHPAHDHPALEGDAADASTVIDADMERELTAIWADLLGQSEIEPTANFFELGGHSLLAARMLARVEARYGRRVTLTTLFRAPSIRGLARLLRSDAREFDFRQMVKLQADGTNLPLIAINNTGVYYLLAKRLGPNQPVISLQLFDPSAREETLPDTLEATAAEYVTLIRRVHPKGPYVLAGWCVAGALAFEIARQLVAAGEAVAQLFLIDSWVPRYFDRQPLLQRLIGNYSLRWQLAFADWRRYSSGQQTLGAFVRQRELVRRIRAIFRSQSAPPAQAADAAANRGRLGAAAPEEYDRWLLEYLQAITYRYEPGRYAGRLTLFRSTHEPTGWLFDPLAGWGEFATGGVDLNLVEGNHFTMFQDPGAAQMAARMAQLISGSGDAD